MFGLMKILRGDFDGSFARPHLPSLSVGSTVGFGFLPQKNISGCRLTVKAVNTYAFGDDSFPCYVLDSNGNDINLIIMRDELDEAHLSISQRIGEPLFPLLFLSHQPLEWFTMKDTDTLITSRRVMGMQQSWVAPEYKPAAQDKGIFAEGDYRSHRKPYDLHSPRSFDYVMLTDKTREHSLEAERYEDGTLTVYATVYRPLTDIGEITGGEHPPRIFGGWEAVPKIRMPDILDHGAFDKILFDKKPAPALTISTKPAKAEPVPEVKAETPKQPEAPAEMLLIGAGVAACIIGEAKKNKTSLAEVIRKVIDLPAVVSDQVMINFSLSDAEYTELAERYKLSPTDHESVRKQIVKELQDFAGNEK